MEVWTYTYNCFWFGPALFPTNKKVDTNFFFHFKNLLRDMYTYSQEIGSISICCGDEKKNILKIKSNRWFLL